MGCFVEARIEQKLDDPTTFAVRFHEDIRNGRQHVAGSREFAIDEIIAIAVEGRDGLRCLSRGPILESQTELTQGGPGSWFEVRGTDRRDLLAREYREGSWVGKASDVVMGMLSPVFDTVEKDDTSEPYTEQEPLAQRGTDLEFVKKAASENGLHFWISYEGTRLTGSSLRITEVANWRASPSEASFTGAPGAQVLQLAGTSLELRLNVDRERCPNLTKFQLGVDGARPTRLRASTMSTADGQIDTITVNDPRGAVGGEGETLPSIAGVRFLPPQSQGNAGSARTVAEAALREAGFFVTADVSTTRHLLEGVLTPHQIIRVRGIGNANERTPFQVTEVVHVINGASHYMDAKLRTNVQIPE